MVLCSHCAGSEAILQDCSKTYFQIAEESLRRRVRAECEMAQEVMSNKVSPKLIKQMKEALKQLNISYGQGKGVRVNAKTIRTPWLVGQINRTLNHRGQKPFAVWLGLPS